MMRCHAMPCRAMQMMRHERPACSLVRLPPPVRCRRPGVPRTPTAATTVTVHIRGDSPRQTICLHTTSRYHRAGCNRSSGLSPRPRGQLSEVPVIPTLLSLSIFLAGSPGRSKGDERWGSGYYTKSSMLIRSGTSTPEAHVAFHRRQMHGRYVPRHLLLCCTS